MNIKLYKIPIIFLIIGIVYISKWEGVISNFAPYFGLKSREIYNWIERFSLIIIIAAVLFLQIKKQQIKLLRLYKKEHELNDLLSKNIAVQTKHDEENKRMSEVLNKISNLVLIMNKDKKISWVNQAYLDFTEYGREDLIGKKPLELLAGPKTDRNTMISLYNAILKEESFITEVIYYKKNGKEYWAQLNLTPIFNSHGKFEFYISVETVITERKRKEEKINEQNKALRQIAWFNSHEIRRPLASILSLLQLLKSAKKKEERKEYLDLLEMCSVELDSAITNIAIEINKAEGADYSSWY